MAFCSCFPGLDDQGLLCCLFASCLWNHRNLELTATYGHTAFQMAHHSSNGNFGISEVGVKTPSMRSTALIVSSICCWGSRTVWKKEIARQFFTDAHAYFDSTVSSAQNCKNRCNAGSQIRNEKRRPDHMFRACCGDSLPRWPQAPPSRLFHRERHMRGGLAYDALN